MKYSLVILAAATFVSCSSDRAQNSSARVLELDSGQWTIDVRGGGESILFIHGGIIAGPPASFLEQESLAGYQLVSYNRRGYAGSPPESGPVDDYIQRHAADPAALLHFLEIEDAHVVGHSSGGTIALQFALSHPELVSSLVLLEPAIPSLVASSDSEEAAATQAQFMALIQGNEIVSALDLFMQTQVGLPEWRNALEPAEVQQAEAYAPTFFFIEGQGVGSWAPPQGLVSQELPVLYISGSESPVPKENVDIVSAWFSRTSHLEISAVSHGLYSEDPESVAEGIADFLRQL